MGGLIINTKILILLQLFAMIGVFAGTSIYFLSTMGQQGMVAGILYTIEDSSALVDGHIVYEGDTIHGVQVVKIERFTVECEKDGIRWKQKVRERPSPHWKEPD